MTGAFAALGALTAWWRASRTGEREHVDVSMLEAMQYTFVTVPTLMARFPGGRTGSFRWVMLPGNEPTGDGKYVGITTVTTQQWRSLLHVIGRDDLDDDEDLRSFLGRFRRAEEVNEAIRGWTMQYTADEVVERVRRVGCLRPSSAMASCSRHSRSSSSAMRSCSSPARALCGPARRSGSPRCADRAMTPAPRLGEHSGDAGADAAARRRHAGRASASARSPV